jgi:hypothetical protein
MALPDPISCGPLTGKGGGGGRYFAVLKRKDPDLEIPKVRVNTVPVIIKKKYLFAHWYYALKKTINNKFVLISVGLYFYLRDVSLKFLG